MSKDTKIILKFIAFCAKTIISCCNTSDVWHGVSIDSQLNELLEGK